MSYQDDERLVPLSESQLDSLEEATASYEASITKEAAIYLAGRGIDKELAVKHRLGVVSDPLPGHGRFQGWLAIPYLDKDGKPLSIRFRCIEQHDHREYGHGKYMSMLDEPPRMFNIGAVHRAGDEIHVTEGELDALILTKLGLEAVAVPGAHLWRPRHRIMLSGFNRIWVWGDPDDAGADFTNKITRSLMRARGVRLLDGDVNDTYLAGGADALLSLIPRGDTQ